VREREQGVSAISLADINIWLDVIFVSLYVVVVLGLSGHFVGNILTGRVKKRFVGKQWPHHEGPPVPFLPKFLHFVHVFSMIALGVTGMYIRFPFFDGGRTAMRYIHYVFMIIVTINVLWRLWYAFFARQRDWREFALTKEDIVTAPKVVLYYIFVKSSKPHLGKYNVMQKGTYILFVPLMLLQAYTGFALVTTPFIFGYSPRDLLLGWWLGVAVGSVDLAGWYARTVHYLINWLFIILTTVHAYLSMTEDFPAFQNFFGLGGGHDHEDHEEHVPHGSPAPAASAGDH
jgi:Ni/Fe-hydrogenase 1 B-type cytochrome subunit